MHLDHMNISAPAPLLEEIRDFYCEVLGLQPGPRPDFGIAGYWLYGPDGDQALVHLIASDQHRPPEQSHLDHIAFQADQLQPIRARLDARGVSYGHLDLPDFNLEQIQFLDPAGIKIEVNCYPNQN